MDVSGLFWRRKRMVDLETETEAAEVKATGEEVEVVTTQATV